MEFSPPIDEQVIKLIYQESGCDFNETINQLYLLLSDNEDTLSIHSSQTFVELNQQLDENNHSELATITSDHHNPYTESFQSLHSPVNKEDNFFLFDKEFIQFIYEENDKNLFDTMEVLRSALLGKEDDDLINNNSSLEYRHTLSPTTNTSIKKDKTKELFAALNTLDEEEENLLKNINTSEFDYKTSAMMEFAKHSDIPVYFQTSNKKINKKKNKKKELQKQKEELQKIKEQENKLQLLCEMFPDMDPSLCEAQLIAFDYNLEEASNAILFQTTSTSLNKKKSGKGRVRNDLLTGGSRWNAPKVITSPLQSTNNKIERRNKLKVITIIMDYNEMKKEKLKDLLSDKGIPIEIGLELLEMNDFNITLTIEQLTKTYPKLSLDNHQSISLIKPKKQEIVYGTVIGPQYLVDSNIVNLKQPAVKQTLSNVALEELAERRKRFRLPEIDSKNYDSLIQSSLQYITLRDKFMELAVQAQEKGNSTLAASYSSKAKQYAIIADDCEQKATDLRKREETGGKPITRPKTLDLHGLFAKDALETLSEYLKQCKLSGVRKLNVITGKGKHSKNHEPVLLPAVEKYLMSNKYNYRQLSPGIFQVKLS
ncbi:hypothetical protein ABK040_004658 [Willaertia magna]